MHAAAYKFVAEQAKDLQFEKVVEFGSRYINGSIRPIFSLADVYVGIDPVEGSGVDVVMPAQNFIPDFEPDVVVCCEVLEHVPHDIGLAIIENGLKILKPGGTMLVTAAGIARKEHSAVDGGPLRPGEHYGNITAETAKFWSESIETPHSFTMQISPDSQDIYLIFKNEEVPVKTAVAAKVK